MIKIDKSETRFLRGQTKSPKMSQFYYICDFWLQKLIILILYATNQPWLPFFGFVYSQWFPKQQVSRKKTFVDCWSEIILRPDAKPTVKVLKAKLSIQSKHYVVFVYWLGTVWYKGVYVCVMFFTAKTEKTVSDHRFSVSITIQEPTAIVTQYLYH